ncbi:MAG: thiamine-phosphate kinase [Bacillota bacterium]|nr:thiamine-phosphate kinase [Bacillota bacterium]
MVKLQDLGEFALIGHLTKKMRAYGDSVILGIGDDAAVFRVDGGKYTLVTCDMLVDGHHFWRDRITPEQLGHKALAVSLSDIAAMGGVPRYALLAVGWPSDVDVDYAEGIYHGIEKLAAAHDVFIIGGDTVSAPQLILDVTVIGEMEDNPVTRTGAKTGHLFAVTGSLGASAAGLTLLQNVTSRDVILSAASRQALLRSHLLPQPRVKEGAVILKTGCPSAMIDISDGLASEIYHICEGSGVGAEIDITCLPVHERTRQAGELLGKDYLNWALYGGEDYELLVSLAEENALTVQKELRAMDVDFTIIGKVMVKEKGVKLLLGDGKAVDMEKKGFDHFS